MSEGLQDRFASERVDPLQGYTERPVPWFLENILPRFTALNLGPSLLDIGCGYGYFTKQYAAQVDWVAGLDFTQERIDAAKTLNAADNILYLACDITKDIPLRNMHDAVSSACFQHILPGLRYRAFANVHRALKLDARLVLYDESFDQHRHLWDDFFEPISPGWLRDELPDLYTLESCEFVCRGGIGEYIFEYVLRRR